VPGLVRLELAAQHGKAGSRVQADMRHACKTVIAGCRSIRVGLHPPDLAKAQRDVDLWRLLDSSETSSWSRLHL